MSTIFSFTHFPEFASARIVLRRAEEKDAKDLLALYSDESVVQFLPLDLFLSTEDAKEEMRWYEQIFQNQSGIRWMIEDKQLKKVIGTCGFLNYEKKHNRMEIGYDLAPEFWGQGFMPEALKLIIEFGFSKMRINKIEAKVEPKNKASIRLLEKLGFQKEGLLRQHEFEKGNYIDLLVFSKLSSDESLL
jgi:[ribosomal protein S5]-alanine N-acetyltransferase